MVGGLGDTVVITVQTGDVDRIAQIGTEIVLALRRRAMAMDALDAANARLRELEREALNEPAGTLYGSSHAETAIIDKPPWLS